MLTMGVRSQPMMHRWLTSTSSTFRSVGDSGRGAGLLAGLDARRVCLSRTTDGVARLDDLRKSSLVFFLASILASLDGRGFL